MKQIEISRRTLLVRACQVPVAGLVTFLGACTDKQQSTVCAAADQQTNFDSGLRASLQYTGQSRDPMKVCSGCAYFGAGADAAQCGTCSILNGPVSAKGHCTSWSAKG